MAGKRALPAAFLAHQFKPGSSKAKAAGAKGGAMSPSPKKKAKKSSGKKSG